MNGDLDAPGWTLPGDASAPAPTGTDLSRVTSRAEARALAEAAAQAQAAAADEEEASYGLGRAVPPPAPVTHTDPFAPARRPAAPRPPITPAPVPSPHAPASHVPGQWGAAAPTPPRPYTPVAAPPPAVEPPPLKAQRSGLSLFGTTVRVLSMLSAAVCGAGALACLAISNDLTAAGAGSLSDPRTPSPSGVVLLVLLAALLVSSLSQICLIVWLAMLARDPRADRRKIKHGPVGTVLGFLLPGLRMVWPYQSMRDVWRATDLRPASKPTPMSILGWWAFTLGSYVAMFFTGFYAQPYLTTPDGRGLVAHLCLGTALYWLLSVGAELCLSFAIGRVCFHLDAHDLLVAHHERTHPSSLYRTA
ncbi:DUF4328 domain-containing protein [Lapillicoccus jejuensis]|uniref:Uncharacterized protein DUF4328 n=1 Tax=Lapillicoccus jejuensis TaxID=402171 RepID=A0A542DY47_9MICO|nr:DUF4328 domain-containing protein [Lapillicoccus jejuensis]TQJ08021.1 uncharacterized protein DUF4328 [Lapillicoccus jejuensis]